LVTFRNKQWTQINTYKAIKKLAQDQYLWRVCTAACQPSDPEEDSWLWWYRKLPKSTESYQGQILVAFDSIRYLSTPTGYTDNESQHNNGHW